MTLFSEPEQPPRYPKSWSATQKKNAASGLHPMGMELSDNGETCKSCNNSYKHNRWWKCRKCTLTFGAGTDIRLKWPACKLWTKG